MQIKIAQNFCSVPSLGTMLWLCGPCVTALGLRWERQEETELCSAAVSWQQITEELKHCLPLWQRVNR